MDTPRGTTPLAPTDTGPTEAEISRALDRLAKARIRLRDASGPAPQPSRPRLELVERARRAVDEAAAALKARPHDPEVQKTHALAEIAEIMALRQEGFLTPDDYDRAVRPPLGDPELDERRLGAEAEFTAAQAEWERLTAMLVGGGTTTVDLTTDPPSLETR